MAWGGSTGQLKGLQTLQIDPNSTRPIGSKSILNGKPVRWAGLDLGWQSLETFKKLETEGFEGDVDYLRNGGWQANRINTAIGEAAQNLKPIGDQYGKFKRGNPLAAWYLESVGQGVGWGLEQLERPVTATSRALNIHPFFGNLAIETAAELATPFVSTTAIKHLPKVIKGVNNLGNVIDTARYRDLTRGIALSQQRSPSLYSGLPLPEELSDLTSKVKSKVKALPKVNVKAKVSPEVKTAQDLLDGIHLDDVPSNRTKVNGHTNGANSEINVNPSTSVSVDKEAFNQLTYSGEIVSSELDGLYKQIEIAKSNLPPGKNTSPQLTKLKQLVSEAKRRKSIIVTTLPDQGFLQFHRRFIDELANAGDDPEKIRRVLDYNFGRTKIEHNISGSSNMGAGYKLEAHHIRYAIESALQLMDVPPAIRKEVLKIQLGRGIRYGDHPANYRGLFRPAHAKAHPLGFSGDSSIELVGELRNLPENASAQQIADAMHKVALNSNKLSLKAAQSKIQIQTAHDFFEGILSPKEMKYFVEEKNINLSDTTSDGWQELRRWVENSGRLQHLGPQSRARYESMALESMNIA